MIAVVPPSAASHGIVRDRPPRSLSRAQRLLCALQSAVFSVGSPRQAAFNFIEPVGSRLFASGRYGRSAFKFEYPCIGYVFGRIGVVYECFVFLPGFLRGSRCFDTYHGDFSIDCKKNHQVWKWVGWRGHHQIFANCISHLYRAACGVCDRHCRLNNRQMVARSGQTFCRAFRHYGAGVWGALYGCCLSCEPRLGSGAGAA